MSDGGTVLIAGVYFAIETYVYTVCSLCILSNCVKGDKYRERETANVASQPQDVLAER